MLVVELYVGEDAGPHEVIAEISPLTEVVVHVWQRCPESLQYHLPVLLTNYLVPNAAGRPDVLLTDRLDFGNHLL